MALLEKSLKVHGFNVGALHGDMDQSARMKTLAGFRNNEITYLIASDVAARGLDIPEVSHVYNFDVPTHAEDYVHRIGRTGRAGREGQAFTLVTKEEGKYWKGIEALIKKEIPYFDLSGMGEPESEVQEEATSPREPRERRPRREAKPKAEQKPAEAKPKAEAKPRAEKPKAEPQEEQPRAARVQEPAKPRPAAPQARQDRPERNDRNERSDRSQRPQRNDRHPQRDVSDAPDSHSFHDGNMPAFLARSVKAG